MLIRLFQFHCFGEISQAQIDLHIFLRNKKFRILKISIKFRKS
jgi:hypothetical protein